jgi:predicted DNA-binding protein with PD1-like motif
MDNDIVAFREDPFDFASRVRVIRLQKGNESLEALRTFCHKGVMLDVSIPDIF